MKSGPAEVFIPPAPECGGVLAAPAAPGDPLILERPRLNELLEKALNKRTAFVIAGEGYGKTNAVHSFLRQKNKKAIWISVSERDNVPWHFWESVINAVDRHEPRAGRLLKRTGFPESAGEMARFLAILSGLTIDTGKYLIVLDDFHFFRDEAVINFVEKLMASSHPMQNAILISRTEPGKKAMALLSKGLLSRIGASELKFNREEIADYFRLHKIELSGDESGEILHDTEGWIMAISHIAEEMKSLGKKYSRSLLKSGSFRMIEETLFCSIPASLRRFLIILSLFDEWPLEGIEKIASSFADRLPPMEELTDSLKHLSSLVHYDAYIHGFMIHRAFLDYLREKQGELSLDEKRSAYTIIARWCMEHSLHMNAAHYFAMADNYEGLAEAIYSLPRLISHSSAATLLEILDWLPHDPNRNEEDKYFLFLRHVTRAGILLNLGRYAESEAVLDDTVRKFGEMPQGNIGSWILSAGYYALGPLSLINNRKSRDLSRTAGYFERGSFYYRQYPYLVYGPGTKLNIGSYANSIGPYPEEGEFEQFIQTVEKSVPYVYKNLGGFLYGMDSLCRAELAFFRGDLNAAEQYAMESVYKARKKGQYETESKGLFYLLRIHACNGNIGASAETWEQIEAQLDITDYLNRYVINDILTGWFHAHMAEIDQIAPWLKSETDESGLNLNFHNFEAMVKAKSLFALGQYPQTLRFLDRKEIREGLCLFHLGMLETGALRAAALARNGNEEAAVVALEAAWEMSACGGRLDMPFIELGEDMRILAGLALNKTGTIIPKAWLETARNRASIYSKKITAMKDKCRPCRKEAEIPFLSAQELMVLTGISQGFTRDEIAGDNSISINSVKSVIKAIYGKLGAFNRADAIRLATKAGILK